MKDDYCPCGHNWIAVNNTVLHDDCYYCPDCDLIYEMTPVVTTKSKFKELYHSNRFEEIKLYAARKEAKRKVTNDDLVKLGYLTT